MPCFDVVLDKSRIVILSPARKMRRHCQRLLVRSTDQKTGDGVPCIAGVGLLVHRSKSGFASVENVCRRLLSSILERILIRAPIKTELERVPSECPRKTVRQD